MAYVRSDGSFLYLDVPYAEFYIPKYYFEDGYKCAEDFGSTIKTIGIMDVGIFEGEKLKEMKVLNIPSLIELYVTNSEDRIVKLPGDDEPTECRVLKYYKDHKIMPSFIIQDSANTQLYLSFILKGKVPAIVPYSKAMRIWEKNTSMNNTHLGVPFVIEELILSVAYRYKQNLGIKYGQMAGKDLNISDYDYKMINVRQICQYSSTFAGVSFEDFDSMITTSLNRTRTHGPEAYSPIESLIKL